MSGRKLKPGWKMVRFGDVVKNVNSVERGPEAAGIERIVGLDHLDPGNLHIRRWDTPGKGTSFTRKFTPGQTLFGKRRAYQRKVAYAEFEGICSGDILTFESKDKDALLPELLPFICQTDSFFEHALGTSAGSLSPRTSWGALSDFEFALPPIEEQQHIADVLWNVDDALERWMRVSACLDVARKAFRADRIVRADHPHSALFQVCTLRGGSAFKPVLQGKKKGRYSFIKVSDMNSEGNEVFITKSENYVDQADVDQMKATVFPAGSVVFAKVGAALLLNRRRILAYDTCIDNNMMAAIPNRALLSSEYLYLALLDVDFKKCVQEGALPSINGGIVGRIDIPLPGLLDQLEILRQYKVITESSSYLQQNVANMGNVFSMLLKSFLDGE